MSITNIIPDTDDGYALFERVVAQRVNELGATLFRTSASPEALWGHYLMHLPEEKRQHYNCHGCRRFIQAFGGLASVVGGTLYSALWSELGTPSFFLPSVVALRNLVKHSRITGVFYADEEVWGTPSNWSPKQARTWRHLSGIQSALRQKHATLTASQREAEKLEEHGMLGRAVAEYRQGLVEEAVRVLRSETLPGSEKAVKIAEWFRERYDDDNNRRWLAIAEAPPGFAHVKTTIISTLLEDVRAGLPFHEIKARWAEKVHPLTYQRATAPPKEGTIREAEKLVAELGLERSLERKFATMADVQHVLWRPTSPKPEETPGVFGHLKTKRAESEKPRSVELPAQTITWEKFRAKVLPEARTLEVALPRLGPYYGLVTAKHADAPPILQWDHPEHRNPVSYYVYMHGSDPERWGLASYMSWGLSSSWGPVKAVFLAPHQWAEEQAKALKLTRPLKPFFEHQGRLAAFAIEGAIDQTNNELALFPNTVKNELHGIRAVIEAHSRSRKVEQVEGDLANGIMFNGKEAIRVRVNGLDVFALDRWD